MTYFEGLLAQHTHQSQYSRRANLGGRKTTQTVALQHVTWPIHPVASSVDIKRDISASATSANDLSHSHVRQDVVVGVPRDADPLAKSQVLGGPAYRRS
jgi:hypothetical protein